jgi:hypothetical protein
VTETVAGTVGSLPPARRSRAVRLPTTQPARYSALAVLAAAVGVIGLVPDIPHGLSALFIAFFVGVGPGCALLAWVGPPQISRLMVVPAIGLAFTITVTGATATVGWWAPRGDFAMIALMILWSVIPNLRTIVRDMVP